MEGKGFEEWVDGRNEVKRVFHENSFKDYLAHLVSWGKK